MVESRVLPRASVADRVYDDLKERIVDLTLAPGSRLNIDALAREFGVSSTPVREALVRLDREHLVSLELYSGYSVAPPLAPDYIAGLIELRMLWEGHCAEIGAVRRDPATLRTMERAFETMASVSKLGTRYREYRKFTDEDARFHQALVDSACNPAMTAIYSGLHILLLQSRLLLSRNATGSPSADVLNEHRSILEAYRKGDGEAAAQAVRAHLAGGLRRLRAIIETNGTTQMVAPVPARRAPRAVDAAGRRSRPAPASSSPRGSDHDDGTDLLR